ncbi:cache domain-containing sensor histidine kinase [Jeotgalibacillus terrae]|uniref:Sensor histidine kinase n=1 Tax=Jeotgalibacillus terrae TaxID=587735 RepID=A0ABW5ZMB1_9BACL|nr:histidine kinase [Jeotgalibacillus terrae]MBM7579643.1 two-component system sensor histidine kinase YesM [Jeotgalibacillus terrae]
MKKYLKLTNWQLTWKFFLIFFFLILIPVLVFGLIISDQANQAAQNQVVNDTKKNLEKASENLSNVFQEIEDISSYMIYSEDFRNYFNTRSGPENQDTLNMLEERISGYTVFHLNESSYLHSITLESEYDNTFHIGKLIEERQQNEIGNKLEAMTLDGRPFWSGSYTITEYSGNDSKVISLFRVINDLNDLTRELGMVTIRLDSSKLYELIELENPDLDQIVVLNEKYNVVLHEDAEIIGSSYKYEIPLSDLDQASDFTYEQDGESYHAVIQPLDHTNLTLIATVDNSSIKQGLSGLRTMIQLMIIVLILLGIAAMIGFYHFNIKRIIELTDQTEKVERGDFSAKVTAGSLDEIGMLASRFNQMVDQINQLINTKYKMELQTRNAELKLLQSQINPHFLYNTLDMIRWTARLGNPEETGRLIEMLSKMFRLSLNRGNDWIHLKDELEYCSLYLQLQQYRLGTSLKIAVYCEAGIDRAMILKQMIQPLIENSIQYTDGNAASPKRIYMRCFTEEDDLIIDVMDNGKGFPSDIDKVISDGTALANMIERLSLAYGERASLTMQNHELGGAWVRIRLPYENENPHISLKGG